jgi:hypothetical protein
MMKIMGRVLIITFVFVLFAGLMIVVVNASGWNAPNFREDGRTEFRPLNGELATAQGSQAALGIPRWLAGVTKNIGIITVLVIMIVWPKSILKNRKRSGL